jgi:hypothetical protein
MLKLKDRMVQIIGKKAADKASELAGEFVHASADEKESILAGIDFERWLAETCQESLR